MGTTSEKLTYLNETKQLLKDKINNLGGSIDDNTTFRNYANQLQNVYDNYPKTEYQEGTSITLENCNKGKLDYENGVVGIGQSEQKTTTGINLCECKMASVTNYGLTFTNNNDGTITISGENTYAGARTFRINQSSYNHTDNPQSYTDGTYTLDMGIANANLSMYLSQFTTWTTFISTGYNTRLKSATISNVTNSFIYIAVKEGAVFTTPVTIKPMLVSGSYTTETMPNFEKYTGGQPSPNPSYPQQIKSVTGNQDVVVSGINVANENEIQIGKSWNNSDNTSRATILFIPIEKGVTYSFASAYTNSHITNIRAVLNYGVEADNRNLVVNATTFTTDTYTHVSLEILADTTFTQDMLEGVKIFLCKGEGTISDYEPYITPKTYQFSLGDHKFYGIGNYKDELIYDVDEDKVYKNEKIIERIVTSTYLNSLLNFYVQSINSYGIANFLLLQATQEEAPFVAGQGLCNYLQKQTTIISNTQTDGIFFQAPNVYIRLNQTIAKTVSEFKNYVDGLNTNGNPLVFYQVLVTPELIEITDTTLKQQVRNWYNAQSNNGTTIITSNGNLPMIIKVRALKGE